MRLAGRVILALALALCCACGDDGGAQSNPSGGPSAKPSSLLVGIGDQKAEMFSDKRWKELKLEIARYVMPWDGLTTNRERVTAWFDAARKAGVRPLVAFNHSLGDQCPAHPCEAPTPGRFEQAFRSFHERYPWVKDISPWNEANHQSQPTGRRPDLAAAYFDAVARVCPDCTIVAADVLTSSNLERWLRTFKSRAKTKPSVYGLHNYPDVNRFTDEGTKAAMGLLDGEVWLTETGGIVEFTTTSGKPAFPNDPERAARAISYAFDLTGRFPRIKRIYLYQWQKTNPQDRFDSGLIAPDGSARPGLEALRDHRPG